MNLNLELLLKTLLLAWWIVNFIPLQDFLTKWIKPLINNQYIKNGLSCGKCLSFHLIWIIGAIKFQDFFIWEAILGAVIYSFYDRLINSLKIYL